MRVLTLLACVLLQACHDDRPPAPSAEDNAQLDEAGNMLDSLANEDEDTAK